MSNPFVLKGRIYQVIFERGPLMYEEILKFIPDTSLKNLRDCIVMDRFNNKDNGKKVFRITGYKPMRGKGGPPRPIIGLGPEPDVQAPVIKNAANAAKRRYDEKVHGVTPAVRAERVFANMFSEPTPVKVEPMARRIYKASNKEPLRNTRFKAAVTRDSEETV